jgi:hypothetical protein
MIQKSVSLGVANAEHFPCWETDSAEVCARIEQHHAPVKMVLKTKNDPLLIERWIRHHMKIVGPENLIVFDNMSDGPEVLSVYREYRDRIAIIRFADHQNNLHHTSLYRDFYRSLAKSSEYFLFLDTDEYLILIEDERYYDDDSILTFVMGNKNFDLFPATWLPNANWSPKHFNCGGLAGNLACGKPLIRSSKIPLGYFNHSFQLSTRLFAPPFKTNLFLLHLARLFPKQRISTNMNKLIGAGIARAGESPTLIARRNDIADEIMAGYVNEIRDCLALEERADLGNSPLEAGCLELSSGGTITYYSTAEQKALNDFIADPTLAYDSLPRQYRLDAVAGASIDTSASSFGRPYL